MDSEFNSDTVIRSSTQNYVGGYISARKNFCVVAKIFDKYRITTIINSHKI